MSRNGLRGHASPRGRDAGTGQFISVGQARRRPASATVERIPDPGFGAQSTSPRGRDARSGQFIPIREAERRPATTEVVRVPNPRTRQ